MAAHRRRRLAYSKAGTTQVGGDPGPEIGRGEFLRQERDAARRQAEPLGQSGLEPGADPLSAAAPEIHPAAVNEWRPCAHHRSVLERPEGEFNRAQTVRVVLDYGVRSYPN